MEVKKIVEGMTAPQVAQVIDDNFKAQNAILEEDIAKQNNVIGVSEYKDFSEAEAVNVGDVRKYNGLLYECVEATTGAFDASKWKKSSFKAETEKKLSELGSNLVPSVYGHFYWEYGKAYNTNGEVGNICSLDTIVAENYARSMAICKEGDVFILNGTAGGTNAKVCVFIDAEKRILSQYQSKAVNKKVVAPKGTSHIVLSVVYNEETEFTNYKVNSIINRVDNNEDEIAVIKPQVETLSFDTIINAGDVFVSDYARITEIGQIVTRFNLKKGITYRFSTETKEVLSEEAYCGVKDSLGTTIVNNVVGKTIELVADKDYEKAYFYASTYSDPFELRVSISSDYAPSNLLKFNGKDKANPNAQFINYEDGSVFVGTTDGNYYINNDGYNRVSATLGFNSTTYAAIAFYRTLNPSVDGYIKSASVQHNGKNKSFYSADVPTDCKLIVFCNRNNSLPLDDVVISLYKSANEQIIDNTKSINYLMPTEYNDIAITSALTIDVPKNLFNVPLIISLRSHYTGTQPTLTINVGRYSSIPYSIGNEEASIYQQFRIPPVLSNMTGRITLNVSDGTTLYVDSLKIGSFENAPKVYDGVHINSHLGFLRYAPEQTIQSFEMAALMGYARCIVNPIKTSDGVWMCYHENKAYLSTDGTSASAIALSGEEFNSKTFEQIREYEVITSDAMRVFFPNCKVPTLEEFLAICSRTGMHPIFSVHPMPTQEDWMSIKTLLRKYNLLDCLTLKLFSINDANKAYTIFGDEIESYVFITYATTLDDVANYCDAVLTSTAGKTTKRKCVELGDASSYTEDIISKVVEKGLYPTIAAYYKNVKSGARYKELISWGVTEFTDDVNPNAGLNW